jgi:hypothetical protein
MEIFVLLPVDQTHAYAFTNEVLLRDMLDTLERALLMLFPKTSMNPWREVLKTWLMTPARRDVPLTLQLGENTAAFTVLTTVVRGAEG